MFRRGALEQARDAAIAQKSISIVIRQHLVAYLNRLNWTPIDQRASRETLIDYQMRDDAVGQQPLQALLAGKRLDGGDGDLAVALVLVSHDDADAVGPVREARQQPVARLFDQFFAVRQDQGAVIGAQVLVQHAEERLGLAGAGRHDQQHIGVRLPVLADGLDGGLLIRAEVEGHKLDILCANCCIMLPMSRRKLNLVRFSVAVPVEVKELLETLAVQNGRSLTLEAGRLLEDVLRERGLLTGAPPTTSAPSR